jgi:branched-chain amino acid transport system substrate-binding protein
MLGLSRTALLAAALSVAAGGAGAQDAVKVGAIYPLTGALAGAGSRAKAAIEIGADIVNTPHPGLEKLPLGAGRGLPHLNGAKIEIIFADHQGNPSVGQSQVARLVSHDKVAALIGAYQSPATLAASTAAEHLGVPFLVPEAGAPTITGRGFKGVFRTTPVGADFATSDARFLAELRQAGQKIQTVAFVVEAGDDGAAASAPVRDALKAAGFEVAADIGYAANATDLAPLVSQLRDQKPDAVIFAGAAAGAALFIKTMKTLDYRPPVLIDAGSAFSDPAFVASVGNLAQGVIVHSAWSVGPAGSVTAIVNDLYKAKTGQNLNDATARITQGFLVLAEAIDRAGSADPAAIRKALRETDLKPDQLIIGFRGVKFDEAGQNTLASSYLIQLRGKDYVTVWPEATGAAKLELPYRGWQ